MKSLIGAPLRIVPKPTPGWRTSRPIFDLIQEKNLTAVNSQDVARLSAMLLIGLSIKIEHIRMK